MLPIGPRNGESTEPDPFWAGSQERLIEGMR